MKKLLLTTIMMVISMVAFAQTADISFDKTTHNFGTFPEESPKVTCTFKFTNTGKRF